ncbi:rRNA maturation RNase YbeY [Nonlabens dokdonensis]|uniref:Endoribonuclease YbeY n=1 Tax=Nonlabens dokdonensis TaxID=328515 RepID=A0A1Z8ALF9_9FLAO|nr:rRNA maturation RNase YbeY [Nonlabens dokdonensis]OUS11167.1 rRNA maturation RNase YbeY [Nonlabens dokdonensis]
MIEFNYQNNFAPLGDLEYSNWLNAVATSEDKTIGNLSYVFCSDDFLLEINQSYLNHDTYTDIITFDYNEDGLLNGEIYISTDRVVENALRFRESETDELHRVMVHGLLHLCGYPDKTDEEKDVMRKLENEKIKMFHVKQ